MKFWLHPRNHNHYSQASMDEWLQMQAAAKLDLTYTWRAESGQLEPLHAVCNKLKSVNGTLGILLSPDTKPEYQRSPLKVPKADDDWWLQYYTETYAPVIAASGVKVELFHFDKEDWAPELNWSASVFRAAVISRQNFHEFLASKLLPPDNPPVVKLWYGQNWFIPSINTSGQRTGMHLFGRLPEDSSRVSNYVNMYWPHIEASIPAFMRTFAYSSTPSGRYRPDMTVVHEWCGLIKNWKVGTDTLTPNVLTPSTHKFWGAFYRQVGIQHVVIYASTNPVLTPDRFKIGDLAYVAETKALFEGASTVQIPSLDTPAIE